ncbi:MAG: protein translocase subunit SecD [Thermodesulfobacteriota bacterium]
MKSIFWRLIALAFFFVLALVLFLPSTSLFGSLPSFWRNTVPKIVLGLDLQGGTHLVLDVDAEKAVENYTQRLTEEVTTLLKKEGVSFRKVKRVGTAAISVSYRNERSAGRIKKVIGDEFPMFAKPEAGERELLFTLTGDERKRIHEWSTSQALETIRNRIDKFGVTEPLIQKQGAKEIVIQLPGLKDPDRAIALIGKTAVLEFKLVDSKGDVQRAVEGQVPVGDELLYQRTVDKDTGAAGRIPFLIKKKTLLTGDLLTDARVAVDTQFNEPYVSLTFNRTGAKRFDAITAENVGERLAIILDGNVYSAPRINERISGGRAQITGNFSYDEATDLAIVLRAGALPAPVNIIQNVTVGPTLGRDSIEAGIRATIIGGILVLFFMILYYRLSGIIANSAMILNILMLLGAMAWFNATLTLPGIAGIILTIGMGVDSNVLIFERIKEELRAGRTPRSAVDAGYDNAWWTIVDAHVTTLITAAVLFQFGSGPIKGFAVTLSLGILINLFTALVGTKLLLDILNQKLRVKRLSI